MRLARKLLSAVVALSALVAAAPAEAKQVICAYDPAGKTGDYFQILEEFSLEAKGWGADIELRAYTDEETATKDYEAGKCDGVVATGVRLQRFNRFPSTLEAIGALPTYDHLKHMINTLANSSGAAKALVASDNETAGIMPVGAVYLFVRDRNIDTVAELAGKRIATMDYDRAAPVMVDRVGAIMVAADLGSIGPKFNNGDVDACYVSAPAFQPFELHRGLGEKGGIIRLPLAQATMQLMIKQSKFPEDFGSKSRKFFAGKFDKALAAVKASEDAIPSKYWVDVGKVDDFDDMFQAVRLSLRDTHKAYDQNMLKVMRNLRCNTDATRPECAEAKE